MNKYEIARNSILKTLEGFNPDNKLYRKIWDSVERLNQDLINLEFRDRLIELGFNIGEFSIPETNCSNVLRSPNELNILKWHKDHAFFNVDSESIPEIGEFVVSLYFSTGPYLIGGDCEYCAAEKFFLKLCEEVESLNPDYYSKRNHHYVWKLENPNASVIWNSLSSLINKYRVEFQEAKTKDKELRILELQAQIDQLKNE